MINIDIETDTLTIQLPFSGKSKIPVFDVIKIININVGNQDIYSERNELDNIINNIANGVNNYPDQIKINLYISSFNEHIIFQYFIVKLIDKINILPHICLAVCDNKCLKDINKILVDINVTKLVFDYFNPEIVDTAIDINWGENISKLVLYGSVSKRNVYTNKIDVFLNKFLNLNSIKTDGVNIDPEKLLSESIFNLEKISTDSTEIFNFATQANDLKKINVIFSDLSYEDDDDIIGNVIYANQNISYIKLLYSGTQSLYDCTVKDLQKLPLKYMNIRGLLTTAETIKIAKYNSNIKHCTFYIKQYTDKCTQMSFMEFINEIPDVINTNKNLESLEFVYDESDDNIDYSNFIIEILYMLLNFSAEANIKSLKFSCQSWWYYDAKINIIFDILNKFSNLQSIIIDNVDDTTYKFEDLLKLLVDNQTIKLVVLSCIENMDYNVFDNTNFFDFNYTLCDIKCYIDDSMMRHKGFSRNRAIEKDKRFKKIKVQQPVIND